MDKVEKVLVAGGEWLVVLPFSCENRGAEAEQATAGI
jgi:hypothetical protein